MLKKELCVVLKKIRIHERDLMITALSPSRGKLSAHAKNAVHSKRFGGTFDLFCLSEWEYMVKDSHEVVRVDRTEIKKSFSHLQETWEQYSVASFFTELILHTSLPNEPCENLFQLYVNSLLAIESTSEKKELCVLTISFIFKLLQWSGIQPILQHCYSCDSKFEDFQEELFLADPQQGGWMCMKCASSLGHTNASDRHQKSDFLTLTPQFLHWKEIELLVYLGQTPIKQIQKNETLLEPPEVLFEFLLGMLLAHSLHREPHHLKTLVFLPFLRGSFKIQSVAASNEGATKHF